MNIIKTIWPPLEDECRWWQKHKWEKWKPFGFLSQQRLCSRCGKQVIVLK